MPESHVATATARKNGGMTLFAAGGREWRGRTPWLGRPSPVPRLRADTDARNILNIAVRPVPQAETVTHPGKIHIRLKPWTFWADRIWSRHNCSI